MKKVMQFNTVMLVVAVLLSGCNDRKTNLLTDTQLSSVQESGVVTVKTKEGNGPWIVHKLIPVLWDGESKMEGGVAYRFNSNEDRLKALSMIPELKDAYEHELKIAAGQTSDKIKETTSPELAGVAANVDCYLDNGAIECDAFTLNGPLGTYGQASHYHGLITYSIYRTVYGPLYDEYYIISQDYQECPGAAETYVSVSATGQGFAWDADVQNCN